MHDTITKTVFLKAPRETVWAFLTEKEKLATWFHPPEDDLAEGRDYALMGDERDGGRTRQCWGTVQHWDPPAKLVWSFTVKPLNGAMTTVTWLLDDVPGGTRLTLRHEGVGVAGEAALGLLTALDKGWDGFFARLREAATG